MNAVTRRPGFVGVIALSTLFVLSVPFAPGCTESTDSGPDETVTPAAGTVGASGGTVGADGVSIAIPAGALAQDVELTVAAAAEPASIPAVTRVGPTVEIGPSGTTFATPAVVTIPFQAGTLPSGATAGDVRLYVAETGAGPFEALASTVDEAAGQVSASVSHLSVFTPGVVTPEAPVCQAGDDCDCEELWSSRPLEITGTADLGRAIRTICHDEETGQVTVLSHTWKPGSSGLDEPDAYFLATLDAATLAVRSDDPTDLTVLEPEAGSCTDAYRERSYLQGEDTERGFTWSAEIVEIREGNAAQADWYEEVLTVSGPAGTARYSLNRHLNAAAPYTDTNSLLREWLLDARNSLVARIAPDGSARFYLFAWHELHVDILYLANVEGALASAMNDPSATDEHGFQTPSDRTRLELREGSTASGYGFNPLYVTADPADPRRDILTVFGAMAPTVRGFGVGAGGGGPLAIEELPALGLDDIYGQFGWQNAGVGPGGNLYIQAQAAQWDNSVLHTLDPSTFTVVDTWELGCIGAPTMDGFQLLPGGGGQLLRFAQPPISPEDRRTARVEFIKAGVIQAIGEVPVNNVPKLWLLAGGVPPRFYLADEYKGLVTAITVPR